MGRGRGESTKRGRERREINHLKAKDYIDAAQRTTVSKVGRLTSLLIRADHIGTRLSDKFVVVSNT